MRFSGDSKSAKMLSFFTMLISMIFMTGCGRSTTASTVVLPALAEQGYSETQIIQNMKDIDIYLDTTPSMAGYLGLKYNTYNTGIATEVLEKYDSLVPETVYMKTIYLLDSIVAVGWPDADKNFYRFDVGLGKLLTRKDFMDSFSFGSFYNISYYEEHIVKEGKESDIATTEMIAWFGSNNEQGYDYSENYLSYVLKELNAEHLSVLITDLYELGDNTGSLYEALASQVIEKGNMVALIGIQSEFAGKIYDLDRYQNKVIYGVDNFVKNQDKSEIKYHPFYILVFGKEDDVMAMSDRLIDKLGQEIGGNKIEKMLFNYEKQLRGFDDYSLVSASPISKTGYQYDTSIRFIADEGEILPKNFYPYKIIRKNYDEEKILTHVFQIEDDRLKEFLVNWAEPSEIDFGEIECDIRNLETGDFDSVSLRKDTFQIADIQWDENGLFQVQVQLKNVRDLMKGLYRFRLHLTYPLEERQPEAWVEEWDLDKSRMNEWLENSETFPGHQTNNLLELVELFMEKIKADYPYHEIAYLDFYFSVTE